MTAFNLPDISVVTPTYNRAEVLPIAIAAAQAQTVPVAEIIIVDDGSDDDTCAIVREMIKSDSRIKLIQQSRGGANKARNAGILAAKSDLIAFLDSDDSWEPEKLEKQLSALKAMPEAVASFTGLRLVGTDRTRVFIPPLDPSLRLLRSANVLSGTSTALIKKSALLEVGAFDASLPSCQDWDLWFRLRQVGPFAVVPEPLMLFSSTETERISTNYDKVFAGHKIVFARLLQGLDRPAARRTQAGHRLVLSDLQLKRREYRSALDLAVSSFMARPTKWGLRLAATAAWRTVTRPGRQS